LLIITQRSELRVDLSELRIVWTVPDIKDSEIGTEEEIEGGVIGHTIFKWFPVEEGIIGCKLVIEYHVGGVR